MRCGIYNITNTEGEAELIKDFNSKVEAAFSYVYVLYYDALYMFTSKLYSNTGVDASDVIHDIFLSVWSGNKSAFVNLTHIKGYLYLSARNYHRKYIEHLKSVERYSNIVNSNKSSFVTDMIEVEVVAKLNMMLDVLPQEYANVLRMYVEGMEVKEIAEELGKPERTIYHQKKRALAILKEKFKDSSFNFILMLLN